MLHARVVVVDDKQVRAVMTASWLVQMGWREVFVLVAAGDETGMPEDAVLGEAPRDAAIDAAALDRSARARRQPPWSISRSAATIATRTFRAHGSRSARGSNSASRRDPLRGNVVLTSEDGVLAGLAVRDARALTPLPVSLSRRRQRRVARRRASRCRPTTPRMADEPVDAWLKPYDRPDGVRQAMADYLAWETDLLPRIERDGCSRFAVMK